MHSHPEPFVWGSIIPIIVVTPADFNSKPVTLESMGIGLLNNTTEDFNTPPEWLNIMEPGVVDSVSSAQPNAAPICKDDTIEAVITEDHSLANRVALRWAKLPLEIKDNIIDFAMTAKKGHILMPCLTNRAHKPDLAVRALQVNHHFYREGLKRLYSNNTIIFDNFGSDLRHMCQTWKECRGESPIVLEVILKLGDNESMDKGELKARSFANVLQCLSTPLRVRRLLIVLERYHFRDSHQFRSFASSLVNVEVSSRFGLSAPPMHIDFVIHQLTEALHMSSVPLDGFLECSVPGKLGLFSGIFPRAMKVHDLKN